MKSKFFIILLNLIPIITNAYQIFTYDFYRYKKFVNFNPSLVLLQDAIYFDFFNNLQYLKQNYEKNNIDYEDKFFKIEPNLFAILPLKNFSISIDAGYNYSISNLFNKSEIFNTFESNQFFNNSYKFKASLALKDFDIGYKFEYENITKENKYLENNKEFNYRYKRELNSIANIFGIKLSEYYFKVGYKKEFLSDFYGNYTNFYSLKEKNRFISDIINFGFSRIKYFNSNLNSIFNIEFDWSLKNSQEIFTIFNENFNLEFLDFGEKFDFYLFKNKGNILLFYGVGQNYFKFEKYSNKDNKWIKCYNLILNGIIGIEFSFLKYFIFHIESKPYGILKENLQSEFSLDLDGGILIKIKNNLSLELRSKPVIVLKKGTDEQKRNFSFIILFSGNF